MHVEIISLLSTSIIAANSLTDTNSVTLIVFFSCSCFISSASFFWLCASRFSRLYFDPLDFPFEVSLASVSFICFCTSSSFTSGWNCFTFPAFSLLLFFSLKSTLSVSFLILFLFFFFLGCLSDEATGFFFSSLAGRSILPTTVGPDNFLKPDL